MTVYQQGAGRVDVARAVTQKVFATPARIDFGFVPCRGTTQPSR